MRLIAASAAVAALALSACSQQASPPAAAKAAAEPATASPAEALAVSGRSRPTGVDLYGYYLPSRDVQAGNWKLDHLHLGGDEEFKAAEAGTGPDTYAPVMLEFEDVTSPLVRNEMGGEARQVRERAMADAYAIGEDGTIVFVDKHPKLGLVVFRGQLDLAALKRAQEGEGAAQVTVLTGELTVGDRTFKDVAFTWFGGD